MSRSRWMLAGISISLAVAIACSSNKSNSPTAPSGAGGNTDATAAADGSTLKASAPSPIAPVNDQALTEAPTLTTTASTMKFGGATGPIQYRFQVFNDASVMVQDSGLVAGPAFKVTAALDFKKRYTWRARAEADGRIGPWSATASFISPEGGYIRGNEVFDPIYNGSTVGEIIGPTTMLPGQGIRLETSQSYVRYLIPQTIQSGEFSVEILGLRANAPGNKSKTMAMSSDAPDFITDPYRIDVQYRGTSGSPPNAITFRALYGSATDLSVRYEPDTTTRLNSVFNLNPSTPYLWKLTWGAGQEVRVTVFEGGIGGRIIYNVGVRSLKGVYNPVPEYAYLGAPTGRSGAEAASIPGTIYRNVWIGARPRPF